MGELSEAVVRQTLETVIHPSFGMSLVALGMIRVVRIEPGRLNIDLVMNCPGCPGAEAALTLARTKLKAIAGGRVVRLQLLP